MVNCVKQNFAVKGMTCAACKARVEKAVAAVPGVERVSVQLLNNSMSVIFDDQKCSRESISSAVGEAGYEAHAIASMHEASKVDTKEAQNQKNRLLASVVLSLILMLFSMGPMVGIDLLPLADANANAQLGMCLLVMALNLHYFKHGFGALRRFSPNMDTLVALGASASFLLSCMGLISIPDDFPSEYLHHSYPIYFESVASILTLVSLGKFLEAKAKLKATDAIMQLYDLAPKMATVRRIHSVSHGETKATNELAMANHSSPATYTGGIYQASNGNYYSEEQIHLEDLQVGDEVVLRAGESIGVDGQVIEGRGYFDESSLTGEAALVRKQVGDRVMSATHLHNGLVVVKVTSVGDETTLSKIIKLVNEVNEQKSPISRLADKVSYFFVPIVIAIALFTFLIWLALGAPPNHALIFAVSVLVVSCPCALGLATPTAIMVATGRAAHLGLLFKNPSALEILQNVDILVCDKTGTLTVGKMQVLKFKYFAGKEEAVFCHQAATLLESYLDHPVAQAISHFSSRVLDHAYKVHTNPKLDSVHDDSVIQEASSYVLDGLASADANGQFESIHTMPKLNPESFVSRDGRGVEGELDGHKLFLGNSLFMREVLGDFVPDLSAINYDNEGLQSIYLFDKFKLLAVFALGDEVKPCAKQVMCALSYLGIRPVIVSGDSLPMVERVAYMLGVSTFKSECLPADKINFISGLSSRNHVVGMIGDGINDAPALQMCDVGLSIASGTDIAQSSADVILMRDDLRGLIAAILLSRATLKNIRENLFWAFIYNIICIPLAAGLFAIFGIMLNPMLAALLMSMSSVCVVLNALRLRRVPLRYKSGNNETIEIPEDLYDKMMLDPDESTFKGDGGVLVGASQAAAQATEAKPKASTHMPKPDFCNLSPQGFDTYVAVDADPKVVPLQRKPSQEDFSTDSNSSPTEQMAAATVAEVFTKQATEDKLSSEEASGDGVHLPLTSLREELKIKDTSKKVLAIENTEFDLDQGSVTFSSSLKDEVEKIVHGSDVISEIKEQEIKALANADKVAPASQEHLSKMNRLMHVEGMNCAHCAKAVERAMLEINGCRAVEVNLEAGIVYLEVIDEVFNDTAVKATIKMLGFNMVSLIEI